MLERFRDVFSRFGEKEKENEMSSHVREEVTSGMVSFGKGGGEGDVLRRRRRLRSSSHFGKKGGRIPQRLRCKRRVSLPFDTIGGGKEGKTKKRGGGNRSQNGNLPAA